MAQENERANMTPGERRTIKRQITEQKKEIIACAIEWCTEIGGDGPEADPLERIRDATYYLLSLERMLNAEEQLEAR